MIGRIYWKVVHFFCYNQTESNFESLEGKLKKGKKAHLTESPEFKFLVSIKHHMAHRCTAAMISQKHILAVSRCFNIIKGKIKLKSYKVWVSPITTIIKSIHYNIQAVHIERPSTNTFNNIAVALVSHWIKN